jgi:hypothetical protein
VYNVLSMEGRQDMWNPWYLMPEDKPKKVWNASFVAMLFYIATIECSSIWVINIMAMGKLKLQCVRHIHK